MVEGQLQLQPQEQEQQRQQHKQPQRIVGWKSQHENDGLSKYHGRDLVGAGSKSPSPKWPNGAKVALNFCIHYEEGSELCVLHGDNVVTSRNSSIGYEDTHNIVPSESFLEKSIGQRDLIGESLYEYGARAGFWRLHRLFVKRKIPCTVFAVGMALERNPAICYALKAAKEWEIASQGYRCINYHNVDEAMERDHMDRSIAIQDRIFEARPVGFFQPQANINTRRLVMEEGGFMYDSNSYADDLPYWITDFGSRPHLVIPYSLTENDLRLDAPNGFATGSQFCDHLKDTLKEYIDDGRRGIPKMMTVSLHCRLARPGNVAAVSDFIEYVQKFYSKNDVWIATRQQIAEFWTDFHFPIGAGTPVRPWYEGHNTSTGAGLSTLQTLRNSLPKKY